MLADSFNLKITNKTRKSKDYKESFDGGGRNSFKTWNTKKLKFY